MKQIEITVRLDEKIEDAIIKLENIKIFICRIYKKSAENYK